MKPSSLLVAGALALSGGNLLAYQIVESRFHVEVAPDKFVDQLVLRCEDGRQITVPWQSKLAESCGEDLMGNVTLPLAKGDAAPNDEEQKPAMLEQLRSQYGNISEKQVEFISTPAGISTRFKPPIVEVLKKYEGCRKALKDKSYCAAERDKALARLADPKATPAAARAPESTETAAVESAPATQAPDASARQATAGPAAKEATLQPAASAPAPTAAPPKATRAAATSTETGRKHTQAAPVPRDATPKPAEAAEQTETAPQPPQAAPAAAAAPEAPPAQSSEAEARAAAEQKVNQDYMACLRAKPKFECDQARTKAMATLDKPKSQKARKPASKPVEPQAQR